MIHESQEMAFQGSGPPTCPPMSTHSLKIAGFKTAMVVLGGGGDAATSVFFSWVFVVQNDCNLLHPAVVIFKHFPTSWTILTVGLDPGLRLVCLSISKYKSTKIRVIL